MLLGIVCAILMTGAGFSGLYLLRIVQGPVGAGLAPVVGIAVLAVVSTWSLGVGMPEIITGLVLLGVCLLGLGLALREFVLRGGVSHGCDRVTVTMLLAALAIPVAVLLQEASVRAGVPDYVHDGAHHVETVDALRHGTQIATFAWYPTGFHAPVAALLSLVPAVDSARGTVDWAVGLILVAPLALFGFATAIWRDTRVGAAGALLLALTSTYPYSPTLYSVWPMAAGLLLVVGLWTTTLQYLADPSPRWAVLGGLLAGGMVLTHGTEVYTAAIGIAGLAASRWRAIASRRVAAHVGLALAMALLLAAPYLPTLGGWAATGGATSVGADYFDARHTATTDDALSEVLFWSSAVSSGFVMDFPVRLALIGIGGWVAFRRQLGRALLPLGILFTVLVAMFRYIVAAPMRAVFALTLPWGVDDRLLMTLPILAAPLGGLAIVAIARGLTSRSLESSPTSGRRTPLEWRRWRIRATVLALAVGLGSALLLAEKFRLQTDHLVTYSDDDAAAMTWLRQHAVPGEILLNDGAADAGIWAPFKANVTILLSRTRSVSPDGPEVLVRANVGHLDTPADVRQATCFLGIRYVYRGAATSPAESRQFPGVDELRTSRALEEVFSSGQAAIFRTRLDCAS